MKWRNIIQVAESPRLLGQGFDDDIDLPCIMPALINVSGQRSTVLWFCSRILKLKATFERSCFMTIDLAFNNLRSIDHCRALVSWVPFFLMGAKLT